MKKFQSLEENKINNNKMIAFLLVLRKEFLLYPNVRAAEAGLLLYPNIRNAQAKCTKW